MDFFDLDEQLRYLSHNGVTLNKEEKLRLSFSLQELLNDKSLHKYEELQLWGKVSGLKADYFVAIGYTFNGKYEFPIKTFFWASSRDFKF
jgi:radial spoke head protein 9